jgi:hypothetical protein
MTDDKMSGIALVAGSVGMIITMALHPTGHELFTPGQFRLVAQMIVATHALGLLSAAVLFLGALGFSRFLGWADRMSVAALVLYGFAMTAVMNAAVASGLLAPAIGRHLADAEPAGAESWRVAFQCNGIFNQGFATVFVVTSSLSIALWSISILRGQKMPTGLGVYGCTAAALTMIGVLSGHVRLNVHGFGAIVLGQAIWYVIAAFLLYNKPAAVPETAGSGE